MTILACNRMNIMFTRRGIIGSIHRFYIELAVFGYSRVAFITRISLVVGMCLVTSPATYSFVNTGGCAVITLPGLVPNRRCMTLNTKPVNRVHGSLNCILPIQHNWSRQIGQIKMYFLVAAIQSNGIILHFSPIKYVIRD